MDNPTMAQRSTDASSLKHNDPRDVLIAARKLIENPIDWGQGARGYGGNRPINTCCALEAIEDATRGDGLLELRIAAYRALQIAAGLKLDSHIAKWNDNHTHAEVLAAFDRAIAATGAA
jgi:hypothetical protein